MIEPFKRAVSAQPVPAPGTAHQITDRSFYKYSM